MLRASLSERLVIITQQRYTQTCKHTKPIIYHSQQCDTISSLIAGKIKGVVTVSNKIIKISCFIISYHIVIKGENTHFILTLYVGRGVI